LGGTLRKGFSEWGEKPAGRQGAEYLIPTRRLVVGKVKHEKKKRFQPEGGGVIGFGRKEMEITN